MKREVAVTLVFILVLTLFANTVIHTLNTIAQLTDPWYIWNYRKVVEITNPGSSNITDYTFKFILYWGSGTDDPTTHSIYLNGKARKDFGDVRFANCDTGEYYYYALFDVYYGDNATAYVKIPNIPVTSQYGVTRLCIYYGNPYATSRSEPHKIYIFYDDFSELDPDIWETATTNGGTIEVINGQLHMVSDNDAALDAVRARAKIDILPPYVIEVKLKEVGAGFNARVGSIYKWASLSSAFNQPNSVDARLNAYSPYTIVIVHILGDGTADSKQSYTTASIQLPKNVWVNVTFIAYDTYHYAVYIDGTLAYDVTFTNTLAPYHNPYLGAASGAVSGAYSEVYIDYIIVRRYADPAPYISAIGSEETVTTTVTETVTSTVTETATVTETITETITETATETLTETVTTTETVTNTTTVTETVTETITNTTTVTETVTVTNTTTETVTETVTNTTTVTETTTVTNTTTETVTETVTNTTTTTTIVYETVTETLTNTTTVTDYVTETYTTTLTNKTTITKIGLQIPVSELRGYNPLLYVILASILMIVMLVSILHRSRYE